MLLSFCCLVPLALSYEFSLNVNVHVNVSRPLAKIPEQFVGITLNSTYIKENWKYCDLKSVKLQTLAKGLSPAYLRVGGTDADFVIFNGATFGDNFGFDPVNFTMSEISWDNIHKFLERVGWTLVFDLNSLYRTNGVWNSSNAEDLIKYTTQKNYTMAGWELGNEPGEYLRNFGVNLTVQQLVEDYQKLYNILLRTPVNVRGHVLTGPSTIPLVQTRVIQFFNDYYFDQAHATLRDFINPRILDGLQTEINHGNDATQKFAKGKQLWIGETSSAWGGGAKGLSDVYVAAFVWLDKLGLAAKNGIGAVIRQTFYGGNYGLVDHVTDEPNPDYWLTYIYKKLVGDYVFQTMSSDLEENRVRFYTHCSTKGFPPGSLTLYGMNLYSFNVSVKLTGDFAATHMQVYLMSAPNNDLRSKSVCLNGKVLKMPSNDSFPDIRPITVNGNLEMPAYSYVFIVLPKANVDLCV